MTGGTNGPMSGEYGLLHAVDERLAAYGYETNTGVKFVVVVDMRGRRIDSAALQYLSSPSSSSTTTTSASAHHGGSDGAHQQQQQHHFFPGEGGAGGVGGRGDALLARRRGMGAAVVGLREGDMKVVFRAMQTAYVRLLQNPFYEPDEHAPLAGSGGRRITSKRFEGDMRKIGEGWTVGVTSL